LLLISSDYRFGIYKLFLIEICFQTFIFLTFENKKISNTCPQSLAGNELIHSISTDGHHELSIYMATSAAHQTENYSTFSVGNEKSKYLLTVTGFSGNKGKIGYYNHKIYLLVFV
jgi:hypothetical protein